MPERKLFTNSIIPLPQHPVVGAQGLLVTQVQPEHQKETMSLLFSLAPSSDYAQQLEEKVAKGEVVSPGELAKYGADQRSFDGLVDWLKAQGFEITHTTPDRTSVYARAPIDTISKALDVSMVRVTKEGLSYAAASNAPSLPADIGAGVHAIIGLQPFRRAHKHFRRFLGSNNRGPDGLKPNISNKPPYLPSEILSAYNGKNLPISGKGQTIGILIDTFPHDADLQAFWNHNDLGVTLNQIEKVNVRGGSLPPVEGEETLDVEWTTGIAPGAVVRIYASGSLSFVDLDRALDQILADVPTQPKMRQVSISLGLGETFMSPDEVATQHGKLLRLAALGVNVFVSSGDAGSNPDSTGHSSAGPLQVEYESSDTCVIGVGGTSLQLTPSGSVAAECAWPGSGGGASILFSRPSWQTGRGVPEGARRLVPDVSAAADPQYGAYVWLNGRSQAIGGTSWSAPVWAGICALLNEAREKAAKPALPFLNPLLYPLNGSSCFRDIISGSNGYFYANPGYDEVTGIGVPNIQALIQALAK